MKRCCTCREEKQEIFFGRHKGWHDGFRPQCKECRNVKLRTGKPKYCFQKGRIPWNKGNYTTNKRKSRRHDDWSKRVRERDGHKCTECGSKENIHAHHIIPWNNSEKLRFDIGNGLSLCGSCHCIVEPRFPENPVPWNKGIKGTHFSSKTEIKKGQRISQRTEFKKGMIPWNLGKKMNKEHCDKLSSCHKGKHCSVETEFKKGMIPWNKGLKKEMSHSL